MNKALSVGLFTGLLLVAAVSPAMAQLDWLKKIKNVVTSNSSGLTNTKLSDTQIGQGLKEALKVGIQNAVKATGQTDGYFRNEAIKILMPQRLQKIEQGLRMIGFNKQLDEFVLSMNRAAEKSAPYAEDIFLDAIFDMTIDDARKIYAGGNTAATEYLKDKTYNRLLEAFRPMVEKSLAEYDITQKYQSLINKYNSIPFAANLEVPDAKDYVVDEALNGLFKVLAQEEQKIRTNPVAQTTQILKQVFGPFTQ